jgi:hypothetical protein
MWENKSREPLAAVNYVYDLDDVEKNHEEYVNRHRVVASGAVERLAKGVEPLMAEPAPAAAAD